MDHFYDTEDAEELKRILSQPYHVVVGNPPYINVSDSVLARGLPEPIHNMPRQVSIRCSIYGTILRPNVTKRFETRWTSRLDGHDRFECIHEADVWKETHREFP